jgi:ketosteroid isomerase-like protein
VSDPVDVVRRYLDALVSHDWPALRACLAPDVHRIGPYRDVYDGREAYAAFLERTMPSLPGYRLDLARVEGTGSGAFVELSETVDDPDGRPLRTDEGIVFDVADGVITRVAVYLQTSYPVD